VLLLLWLVDVAGGLRGGGDVELFDEAADAAFDLVAERADAVEVPAGRVVEVPVLVAGAGEDGAGVATTHGDDDVCGTDDLVGPRFGVLGGDVDARSAIAATAAGLTSVPGSEPPDQATARSPVRWVKNPSAIWERPALWVHRNSTTGLPSR
jgi:hypothetical protein